MAHDKAPQVLLDHHRQHQGASHLHIDEVLEVLAGTLGVVKQAR